MNAQKWEKKSTQAVCKTARPSAWDSQDVQLSTTRAAPQIANCEAVNNPLFLRPKISFRLMMATG